MSFQRPSGKSPLIEAASTSFLLAAPDPFELAQLRPKARNHIRQNLTAIVSAAERRGVQVFIASPIAEKGGHGLADDLHNSSLHSEFYSTQWRQPWLNPDLVTALAGASRSALVLAGFWLEFQIVTTALHALAESYDVYFVIDASPAQTPPAAIPSHLRLVQAGATPVVAAQVIHEWSLEGP